NSTDPATSLIDLGRIISVKHQQNTRRCACLAGCNSTAGAHPTSGRTGLLSIRYLWLFALFTAGTDEKESDQTVREPRPLTRVLAEAAQPFASPVSSDSAPSLGSGPRSAMSEQITTVMSASKSSEASVAETPSDSATSFAWAALSSPW